VSINRELNPKFALASTPNHPFSDGGFTMKPNDPVVLESSDADLNESDDADDAQSVQGSSPISKSGYTDSEDALRDGEAALCLRKEEKSRVGNMNDCVSTSPSPISKDVGEGEREGEDHID
jgi:hypothetical protein